MFGGKLIRPSEPSTVNGLAFSIVQKISDAHSSPGFMLTPHIEPRGRSALRIGYTTVDTDPNR
jgi:hypothetical protein